MSHRSAGLAALGDLSNATMARLHALRSVILVERGELERASAEAPGVLVMKIRIRRGRTP